MYSKSFTELHSRIDNFVLKLDIQESYSLDRIIDLLQQLGNPQDNLKVIHVAGTSGKTSTCYYIAELLKQNGCSVGLTVSPHIVEINERVQINLTPLDEQAFCSELNEYIAVVEKLKIIPTYFELFVAFAYWYFNKIKVDYAVVEVGLGGLLDATNIVSREDKICVITDIGFDHTDVLGSKLEEITKQKAGIIQDKNTVFMNNQREEIIEVIRGICVLRHANLIVNDKFQKTDLAQILNRNFSLACQAVQYVLKRDYKKTLKKSAIEKSAELVVPARIEKMKLGGKTIILDGAHNYQKMKALVESLQEDLEDKKICVVLAVGENKKEQLLKITDLIKQIASEIVVTSFSELQDLEQKSLHPDYLAEYFPDHKVKKTYSTEQALKIALESEADTVLFTGSLYLISAVKKHLN